MILPLTLLFLALFSSLSTANRQQLLVWHRCGGCIVDCSAAERSVRQQALRRYSKQIVVAAPRQRSTAARTAPCISHRLTTTFAPTSRINLYALQQTTDVALRAFAQQLVKRVLQEVYGHVAFWQPQLAAALVLRLQAARGNDWQQLFDHDDPLFASCYALTAGTNAYCLASKRGYPRLSDLFFFAQQGPLLFSYRHAHQQLLAAAFSSRLAGQVVAIEQSNQAVISWQQFAALVAEEGIDIAERWFRGQQPVKRRWVTCRKGTPVGIERRLPKWPPGPVTAARSAAG